MNLLAEKVKQDLSGRRVLIVGDLVADQFLNGTISRVSREAPVFILRHDETETRPGGAANAAANVSSLGGQPELLGLVGTDEAGRLLLDSLTQSGVDTTNIITAASRRTVTKVRVLAGQHYAQRQQVIRIDYEESSGLSRELEDDLISKIKSARSPAAVIISDYGYGVVTERVYTAAKNLADRNEIPLIVDSRFGLTSFTGAASATPNLDEVAKILGSEPTDVACEKLRQDLSYEALLVTCGNKGMKLYENGKPPHIIDAVGSTEPVDVTGAGDTVIAAYSLSLAAGYTHADAAAVANYAGGISVMKKGSAQVTLDELNASIAQFSSSQTKATS